MLNFKNLKISNFMSISEAELPLDRGGFTLISAENHRVEDSAQSNGSGKSSIGEALFWCLTGETIRGHKNIVNMYTTGNCSVTVTFEFKGHNWAITRVSTRSKEKSLEIEKDGMALPTKGYRDALEVFSKELPEITSKFMNSVVILGQGLPGRFTNNSPSGRKAVLEELTNADFMISQVKEGISHRKEVLSGLLRESEDNRLSTSSKKERLVVEFSKLEKEEEKLNDFDFNKEETELNGLLIAGKTKKLEVEEIDKKVLELKAQREEVVKKIKNIDSVYLERFEKFKKEVTFEVIQTRSIMESDIERIRAEEKSILVSRLNLDKTELKESLDRIVDENKSLKLEIESKIISLTAEKNKYLKTSTGVCETCGQVLPGFTQSMIEEAKLKVSNLSKEIKELSLKKDGIEDKIKELQIEYRENVLKVEEDYKRGLSELEERLNIMFEPRKQELVSKELEIDKFYNKLEDEKSEETSKFNIECTEVIRNLEDATKIQLQKNNELDSLRNQYSDKKAKISYHKERLKALSVEKINLEKERQSLQEALVKYQSEIEDFNLRLGIIKKMETFASRDFRGILLEEVIKRLDTILKGYSEKVYGNELTNFYQEGNSIVVEFDGREYESLSGGEKQKLDVILQLSLRDLIIELTGISSQFIMLDEVFDGLDYLGCEKMISLFQNIEGNIFIITHHQELDIPYDYNLLVIKGEDGIAKIVY